MRLEYDIVYTNRKTVQIAVERDRSVVVRAPRHATIDQIENLIRKKKQWIWDKLRHPQKYPEKEQQKEFVSGESLLYLGKHYTLKVEKKKAIHGLKFDNGFVISESSRNEAKMLFKVWYKDQAAQKIKPKVDFFAKRLGVKYNQVILKELKYRWGSCTSKSNLVFNWKLIKAPMFVIDYVIVHELAHLILPDHSPEFWNIVAVQQPNYKKAKKWLLEHGGILEVEI